MELNEISVGMEILTISKSTNSWPSFERWMQHYILKSHPACTVRGINIDGSIEITSSKQIGGWGHYYHETIDFLPQDLVPADPNELWWFKNHILKGAKNGR